ncbi:MAG: hypothetical protein ACSNEK_02025 [Parachlamydiaceae bacterium]
MPRVTHPSLPVASSFSVPSHSDPKNLSQLSELHREWREDDDFSIFKFFIKNAEARALQLDKSVDRHLKFDLLRILGDWKWYCVQAKEKQTLNTQRLKHLKTKKSLSDVQVAAKNC